MDKEATYPVKTIEKTIQIIGIMNEGHQTVTDISSKSGYNKSCVHRHLTTLEECGYVIKSDNGYRPSLKFLEVGGSIRNGMDIYRVAQPEINRLAEETGELSNLMVEQRGRGVYLKRSKGGKAVDLDTYPGKHVNLHNTALGKAILAHAPRSYVNEVIEYRGMSQETSKTITDRDELFDELETIQVNGFAQDEGERLEGLRCVAAPITTENDVALGAISVSAPASRLSDHEFNEDLPSLVKSAANVVELNLKY